MPEVSVIIPTLGSHERLRRVLDGYDDQDAPAEEFEVIVVMDVAEPDSERVRAVAAGRSYGVSVLTGSLPGASANRNAGIEAAKAPILLLTDNDTIPSPHLVAEHLRWHRRYPQPEVGVLGHVRWASEIEVTSFMHWLDQGIQFDFPSIQGVEAGWGRFYSSNCSLKRAFADRVGGFDEENLPYGYEDLDFGYRASKLGFRLLYNRRAEVEHLREMDLEFWRERVMRLAHAEHSFVEKHPEIPAYFLGKFSEVAHLPPARGRGRALIRWVPRNFPWLGERVWTSADLFYRQALAPRFLETWSVLESSGRPVTPYLNDPAHSGD